MRRKRPRSANDREGGRDGGDGSGERGPYETEEEKVAGHYVGGGGGGGGGGSGESDPSGATEEEKREITGEGEEETRNCHGCGLSRRSRACGTT